MSASGSTYSNIWPKIEHVGMISDRIISITVQNGQVIYGQQQPYLPMPGDCVLPAKDRWLERDSNVIGALVGIEGQIFFSMDRFETGELDLISAGHPESYIIISSNDAAYHNQRQPLRVNRKTKPTDLARVREWSFEAPQVHHLYLEMPEPLKPSCDYTIQFQGLPLCDTTFSFIPARLVTEAIHISQTGFRPTDHCKIAYLSCWLGDGGGLEYSSELHFQVIDQSTNKSVYRGAVKLSKNPQEAEDNSGRNFTGTWVYEMDFGSLSQVGVYRIVVDGIGCSLPFEIRADAWEKAFAVSVKGFYHQRSGIALGPPYTEFIRPCCFHADIGMKVTESRTPITDTNNGFRHGVETDNFGNLVAGQTDHVMDPPWGGYMDAGDWDRRTQHLVVSRLLLELECFSPDFFRSLEWNIPKTYPELPDLLNEALFCLDFYRKLQTESGGVRGGIESAEHPRYGEGSWQESLSVFLFASDLWTSYVYSGIAARAAARLHETMPDLSQLYQKSAIRAFDWAETQLPTSQPLVEIRNTRNLAAVEMYALTGEHTYHQIFLQTLERLDLTQLTQQRAALYSGKSSQLFIAQAAQSLDQQDSAWVYLQTLHRERDLQVIQWCQDMILQEADEWVAAGNRTAFHWTQHPNRLFGVGTMTAPDVVGLVRAHRLTGEKRYLHAIQRACQVGAGANPANVCYTTGLGINNPQNPLHFDSRVTNQPPPPGITVLGPVDAEAAGVKMFQDLVEPFCHPPASQWPMAEAYWDVFWYPEICEYTVQLPMAKNVYTWGYLALQAVQSR